MILVVRGGQPVPRNAAFRSNSLKDRNLEKGKSVDAHTFSKVEPPTHQKFKSPVGGKIKGT